jgi:hypothetical protein
LEITRIVGITRTVGVLLAKNFAVLFYNCTYQSCENYRYKIISNSYVNYHINAKRLSQEYIKTLVNGCIIPVLTGKTCNALSNKILADAPVSQRHYKSFKNIQDL